ncbi:MAG: hypothetical protein ACU84H_12905, partial [Gammaproteobacteria bacterium]
DLTFPPINLWTVPMMNSRDIMTDRRDAINRASSHAPELPDADCPHCKYRGQYEGGHCYMFETKPGDKCAQFKPGN